MDGADGPRDGVTGRDRGALAGAHRGAQGCIDVRLRRVGATSPHAPALTPAPQASPNRSPFSAFSTSSAGGVKRSPYRSASSRARATKPGSPPS
ncbi:hypothetical protein SGRIM119S_03315 [Streptomyces griseorubiginosus]